MLLIAINIPFLQNYISRKIFASLFGAIAKIRHKFVMEIISKQISYVINSTGKVYLNKENDIIHHTEINKFLSHTDNIKNGAETLLQNVIVVSLLMYLRSYSEYYYSLARRLYNYSAQDRIRTMKKERVIEILNDVCDKKQWDVVLQPQFIQALIFIYCDDEFAKDKNIFKKYSNKLNYSIGKFVAVWSVASVIESWLYIPFSVTLLYSAMLIGKYYIINGNDKKFTVTTNNYFRMGSIGIGLLMDLFGFGSGIVSFTSEFAYYLLFNKAVKGFFVMLRKKGNKIKNEYHLLGIEDLKGILHQTIVGSSIYAIAYNRQNESTLIDVNYAIVFSICMASLLFTCASDLRKVSTFITTLVIGLFSNFNPIHILMNIYVYYLICNYVHSEHFYNLVYTIKYKTRYKLHRYIDKHRSELKVDDNDKKTKGKNKRVNKFTPPYKKYKINQVDKLSTSKDNDSSLWSNLRSQISRKKTPVVIISNYLTDEGDKVHSKNI
jgi:hypothetical protein